MIRSHLLSSAGCSETAAEAELQSPLQLLHSTNWSSSFKVYIISTFSFSHIHTSWWIQALRYLLLKAHQWFPVVSSLEGEHGQPRVVDELVYGGNLKNGFFIEAGSYDSEQHSDSLYWELKHGWTGLLVEPDPIAFDVGLTRSTITSISAQTFKKCIKQSTSKAFIAPQSYD